MIKSSFSRQSNKIRVNAPGNVKGHWRNEDSYIVLGEQDWVNKVKGQWRNEDSYIVLGEQDWVNKVKFSVSDKLLDAINDAGEN